MFLLRKLGFGAARFFPDQPMLLDLPRAIPARLSWSGKPSRSIPPTSGDSLSKVGVSAESGVDPPGDQKGNSDAVGILLEAANVSARLSHAGRPARDYAQCASGQMISWVKPRRIDVANIGLRRLGKFHLGQTWMPTRFAPPRQSPSPIASNLKFAGREFLAFECFERFLDDRRGVPSCQLEVNVLNTQPSEVRIQRLPWVSTKLPFYFDQKANMA
jgi:hypothetical protein